MNPDFTRAEPETLVPAARVLCERGLTRDEVVRAIYGAEFPRDVVAFLHVYLGQTDATVTVLWSTTPWELMRPGGPQRDPGAAEVALQRTLYKRWPNVVLLFDLNYRGSEAGQSFIGYDLDHQRIVGLSKYYELHAADAHWEPYETSLIELVVETAQIYAETVRDDYREDLNGVTLDEVTAAEEERAQVEALRAELAALP